jgi:hypothetical protein
MGFLMDSLWPYLQVKQPYLDCVTTIRVRLQEPFSALGEAVKRMTDHAEDFTGTGTKHLERRTPTLYKYGYAPGSRLLHPCLPSSLTRGRKKLAWPSGARARQSASVIEFELFRFTQGATPYCRL